MNLNALLYPELRHFEAYKERRAAWRQATRDGGVRRACWFGVPLLIAAQTVVVLVARSAPNYEPLLEVGSAAAVAVAVFGLFWFMRQSVRRSLRRQLRERGVPICIGCGYDLTRHESGRCPECGREA